MCGIAGYVNADPRKPADPAILRAMNDVIRHRGPDDDGFLVEGPAALGMRRLSIIDLAGGKQPISNEDGRVSVVFNGEIYNYKELKAELEGKGHRFKTASDTEVLVHLYEEEGEGLLGRLNAMLGMALWDSGRRRLVLARDRMGKKPLHWTYAGGALIFGSELKSLLKHPAVRPSLDRLSLAKYLVHEYVPAPRTIYDGIHKLLPGHFLVFENGHVRTEPYWDLPGSNGGDDRPRGDEELAEELRALIQDAVRIRLMSEVPLGVLLSGGVDSSAVTAAMCREAPGRVKSFSIAFRDPSFDESAHFRKVAKALGTDHHEQVLEPETMVDLIPKISGFLDEPLGDASILPTYLLSRFTRQNVTVALGGDGGDELFAGYPTYQAAKWARAYCRVPAIFRKGLIEPLIRALPVSYDNLSLDFKLKKFIAAASEPPARRQVLWLGSFGGAECLRLLSPSAREGLVEDGLYGEVDAYAGHGTDDLSSLLYIDQKMYLQDGILVKTDRASMACSLEVRAPLLDYRIVEWAARRPSSLKLRGMTTKYILKKAVGPWLPPEIVGRPKKGFGMPVGKWIRGPIQGLARDLLDPGRLGRQGLLDPVVVGGLLERHLSGREDNRKKLWTLLVFQLWLDKWGP